MGNILWLVDARWTRGSADPALGQPNHLSTYLLGLFDPDRIGLMTDENTKSQLQ